jgi:hypothetical protein
MATSYPNLDDMTPHEIIAQTVQIFYAQHDIAKTHTPSVRAAHLAIMSGSTTRRAIFCLRCSERGRGEEDPSRFTTQLAVAEHSTPLY